MKKLKNIKDKFLENLKKVNFKDRNVVIKFVGLAVLLVFSGSFTYAYFALIITGNDNANDIVTTTANLSLEYLDGPEIKMLEAYPGQYVNKTVHITNTGSVTVAYAMELKDYINTFIGDEFVISYTCTSYENYGGSTQAESGTCNPFPETVFNKANSSNNVIDEGIQIAPGITHELTFTFKFKETGSVQDENQGQTFAGTLNIQERGESFNLVMQVLDDSNKPIPYATVELHSVPRSGRTDGLGIVTIPNVSRGNHTVKVTRGNNVLINDSIYITSSPNSGTVSGTTIVGKSGETDVELKLKKSSGETTMSLEDAEYSKLTVRFNGISTGQSFYSTYPKGTQITIKDPTVLNINQEFSGWSVTGGNFNDSVLTLNDSNVILEAKVKTIAATAQTIIDNINDSRKVKGLYAISQAATGQQNYATTEYRFQGASEDVNNYVRFGGYTWRIIGIFQTEANGEYHLKLFGYDNGLSTAGFWTKGTSTNWANANLQKYLNTDSSDTYERVNFNIRNAENVTELGFLTNIRWYLEDIYETKWYLGNAVYNYTALQTYQQERSTTVLSGNPTNWTGKVGLMYPSDYLYASLNCYQTGKSGWSSNTDGVYDTDTCRNSNWLDIKNQDALFISPTNGAGYVLGKHYLGCVTAYNLQSGYTTNFRPVLYLKSDVILDGNGTPAKPWVAY